MLDNPLRSRVTGHVEVQDLASTMVNNKQAVQKLERDGWDREEIECDDRFAVVLEARQPILCRIPTPVDPSKVTRHGPLAEIKSNLQQLAVDSGRSPARILLCQVTD